MAGSLGEVGARLFSRSHSEPRKPNVEHSTSTAAKPKTQDQKDLDAKMQPHHDEIKKTEAAQAEQLLKATGEQKTFTQKQFETQKSHAEKSRKDADAAAKKVDEAKAKRLEENADHDAIDKEVKLHEEAATKAHNNAVKEETKAKDLEKTAKGASLQHDTMQARIDVHKADQAVADAQKPLDTTHAEINRATTELAGKKMTLGSTPGNTELENSIAKLETHIRNQKKIASDQADTVKDAETALAKQETKLKDAKAAEAAHKGGTPSNSSSSTGRSDTASTHSSTDTPSSLNEVSAKDLSKLSAAEKETVEKGIKDAGEKGFFDHKGTRYIAKGYESTPTGVQKIGGIKGNFERHPIAYYAAGGVTTAAVLYMGYSYMQNKKEEEAQAAQGA
jgi:hypothetical protein